MDIFRKRFDWQSNSFGDTHAENGNTSFSIGQIDIIIIFKPPNVFGANIFLPIWRKSFSPSVKHFESMLNKQRITFCVANLAASWNFSKNKFQNKLKNQHPRFAELPFLLRDPCWEAVSSGNRPVCRSYQQSADVMIWSEKFKSSYG